MKFLNFLPGGNGLISNRLKAKPFTAHNLHFSNRIGLAAGFDKNAELLHSWKAMGFGHIEIGTVTPKPQEGNPKPRLFRLISDEAIINRMGFNNLGVNVVAKNLENRPRGLIIGGNIGKNKITPNEDAAKDYLICLNTLHPLVDYFTVNVSSPNTPELRALQSKEPLTRLLSELKDANLKQAKPKPIFLKIAPDLSQAELEDIVNLVNVLKLEGVVATNTTISRENLRASEQTLSSIGAGGLSGAPLFIKSRDMVVQLSNTLHKDCVLTAVGGISTPENAADMFNSGAQLLQIYTSIVYQGPQVIADLAKVEAHF